MNPKNWPHPKFGDVVWCRFPYGGDQTTERHPCLVLEAGSNSAGQVALIVAGGSSSNKSGGWEKPPAETDFLVQSPFLQAAGLAHPTKFNFEPLRFDSEKIMIAGAVMTLTYDEDYFVSVQPSMTPKGGHLDIAKQARLRDAFFSAAMHANLKQTIEQEKERYRKRPEPPVRKRPKP
jgi:hypothetical protein